VLTVGDPGVTQQRVVTEYGYEATRAMARDERGGGRVTEGVRWWSESSAWTAEMLHWTSHGGVDDEKEIQELYTM